MLKIHCASVVSCRHIFLALFTRSATWVNRSGFTLLAFSVQTLAACRHISEEKAALLCSQSIPCKLLKQPALSSTFSISTCLQYINRVLHSSELREENLNAVCSNNRRHKHILLGVGNRMFPLATLSVLSTATLLFSPINFHTLPLCQRQTSFP